MQFREDETSRIIEMAWEDRTPFEAIHTLFGLDEQAVIQLMRRNLKPRSFNSWRTRVSGRKTKHLHMRSKDVVRGYCKTQYKHR
ncbi:TIGR03643 family protein [Pseudoalteromonas luteoviolacea]|uniref:TIGR03643 family protein n=1 Tax=Pseudoalteromonas luteoviolacea TaxID=43657 RepID=UPI0009BF8391|nr:TIGR03643 family protein [Pseudoalteromonas luteoviolacea]